MEFILLSKQLFDIVSTHRLLFFEMGLVLRFHIADLCVYVLFKCTYNLFESSELLLYSLVSCCNAFDHDRFNFLNLSPVIVQFSLYSLLPPVHCRLYAIHHIFKLFVLL
jgi:hypothetical protein